MEELVISGKDLGGLALESFCPRCFWIKRHCRSLPFQIFPGIFSTIDSYSKKITNVYYEKYSKIPKWLSGIGDLVKPVKAPTYHKFFTVDKKTNVRLRGTADEIIQKKDESYHILDYKTAKYTANQDALLPMYEVQLNAYAYIGNAVEFNPVTGLSLIYYEPGTELTEDNIDSYIMANGFTMPFISNIHPIKLDPNKMIPPLLKKVREIVDKPKPPKGNQDCKDCEKLDGLVSIIGKS